MCEDFYSTFNNELCEAKKKKSINKIREGERIFTECRRNERKRENESEKAGIDNDDL